MSTNAEALAAGSPAEPGGTGEAPIRKLGKYIIEKKLGQGGMGAVYLGRDPELRRMVAIKVLPRDKASNPILVRRFKAEAQAAAQLRHENIVAVFDSDEADGYLFIAMEFVDGHDLHEMISRRGTVPVKRSIEIIKQVAAALQHAHEHKIVHRDIKPSNLLIRHDGVVKLTDLGLARSVDDTIETGITRAGTTVGTVDYMAPEQARNSQAADIRSDLYSLGCTWYQMLTGKPPYPEGSLTNKLQAHATKALPDPRAANSNVTEGLVAVIHRMMAKKAEDRYQTPAELLADLASSSLTRAAFSQEILNALDDEPATEQPAAADVAVVDAPPTKSRSRKRPRPEEEAADEVAEPAARDSGSRSKPTGGARSGSGTLPPPSRKRPLNDADDERIPGPWAERMKVIVLVCGVIAAVGGIGWLASGLGDSFGLSSAITVVPKVNPDQVVPVPNSPEVAAVSGGVNHGEALNTTTAVATVYGTQPPPGTVAPGVGPAAMTPGTSVSAVSSVPITADALGRVRPADPTQKPNWTAPAAATPAAGSSFSVGPGESNGNHFRSLNDALAKLPAQGGVVKLRGDGPFSLSLVTPIAASRLTLLGDPEAHTVVVLAPAADGQYGRLQLTGELEVSHVHFVLDRTAAKATADGASPESNLPSTKSTVSMLTVQQGSCLLTNSSLTVLGSTGPTVSGITMIGGRIPQQLRTRRLVLRGEMQTGIDLHTSAIDVVVDESLLAVGGGSLYRFQGAAGQTDPQETSRWVRTFASTLCADTNLIDFAAEAPLSEAPKTELVFRDVLGCTASRDGPRTLLNVSDWRQQSVRDQIAWSNHNSSFIGFDQLVNLGSKSSFRADKPEEWRQFWRQAVAEAEFVSGAWPERQSPWSELWPTAFDINEFPDSLKVIANRADIPGVRADWLRLPESLRPERFTAMAARPSLPVLPAWKAPAGDLAVINMREQDLGQVLARNQWPDGAVIQAIGFGICQMTPVKITSKSLKLVFRQAEGGPLRLMPKESTAGGAALFEVENGVLELEGLRLQLPEFRPRHPGWVVSGENSTLVLRNCDLRGLDNTSSIYQGVIRFQGAPKSPLSQLVLQNSMIVAPGPLILMTGPGRLFANDSLLVTNDRILDLRLIADGTRIPMTVDVTDCTLSSAGKIVQVTAAALPSTCTAPAQIYLDRCACVPAASWKVPSTSSPVWLTCDASALEQRQLQWWGNENGLAKSINPWLIVQSVPPRTAATIAEWERELGSGHEQRLLTGEDGIVLANPLSGRVEQLEPEQFLLHLSSKSVTWAQGSPIGANLAALNQLGPAKADRPAASTSGSKTKPETTKKPMSTKRPAF